MLSFPLGNVVPTHPKSISLPTKRNKRRPRKDREQRVGTRRKGKSSLFFSRLALAYVLVERPALGVSRDRVGFFFSSKEGDTNVGRKLVFVVLDRFVSALHLVCFLFVSS